MVEDIIEEILVRLPAKSLSRCKSLSKEYHSFISHNRCFRERYLSRNKECYFMVGIFSSKEKLYCKPDQVHFLHTSMEGRKKRKTLAYASGPNCQLDESLTFLGQDEIYILATSNGFLLCTNTLGDFNTKSYFICNPTNKEWVALPTPTVHNKHVAHGFVCYSSSPRLDMVDYYKVVRAIYPSRQESTNLRIEIYSSDMPEWKLVYLACPNPFFFSRRLPSTVVVEREVIYFGGKASSGNVNGAVIGNGVLIFDQRKQSVQLLLYPPLKTLQACSNEWFGKTAGSLRYARVEAGEVRVWMLSYDNTDGCKMEWSLKHTVLLEPTVEVCPHLVGTPPPVLEVVLTGLHPLNPNIVFMCARERKVLLCDLESSKLELNFSVSELGWKFNYYYFPYIYGLIGPHLFLDG